MSKIIGVIDEDPFASPTWSGSSRFFFGALKDAGSLVDAIAADPGRARVLPAIARSFSRNRASWRFAFHLDPSVSKARTKVALGKLAGYAPASYDLLLQVGAWYDFRNKIDKPILSYHDGNLAGRLASPYGYPAISQRKIAAALRHERKVYEGIDQMFPMSKWLADSFHADFGVPFAKLEPVYAGVNLPRISEPSPARDEQPTLLFVGKDFERKGGRDLLEAFKIVRKEIPDLQLIIVGPTLAAAPDGVQCVGFLDKSRPEDLDRLLGLYARSQVFVLPSLYEPFGIAFAEAMAHRMPCIGTAICAMPEIIVDGETGYVVPPKNPALLAARLLDILKNPGQRSQMGAAGFARYERLFTWKSVARRILDKVRDRFGR